MLLRANFSGAPLRVPATVLTITPLQRASDATSNLTALGLVAVAAISGWLPSLVWGWLLPRAIVFWLHAYAICFFPHAVPGGGYEVYRVRTGGWWLSFVTVGQNFHGVHHRWPYLPWHRYAAVVRDARPAVEAAGIRFV